MQGEKVLPSIMMSLAASVWLQYLAVVRSTSYHAMN